MHLKTSAFCILAPGILSWVMLTYMCITVSKNYTSFCIWVPFKFISTTWAYFTCTKIKNAYNTFCHIHNTMVPFLHGCLLTKQQGRQYNKITFLHITKLTTRLKVVEITYDLSFLQMCVYMKLARTVKILCIIFNIVQISIKLNLSNI